MSVEEPKIVLTQEDLVKMQQRAKQALAELKQKHADLIDEAVEKLQDLSTS